MTREIVKKKLLFRLYFGFLFEMPPKGKCKGKPAKPVTITTTTKRTTITITMTNISRCLQKERGRVNQLGLGGRERRLRQGRRSARWEKSFFLQSVSYIK